MTNYETRVRELENEGMTTSDAQACVDAEHARAPVVKDEWQVKQAAAAVLAAQLVATHPHLIPVSDKNNSLIAAAKNIRIELAAAFPGVVFRVKSRRFSGGDAIDVSWIDGPTSRQVDTIVGQYDAGTFDGQTDSYSYRADRAWTDAFGDAKYTHTRREYSDRWITAILYRVAKRLGGLDRLPTLDDYKQGRLWNLHTSGGCDFGHEFNVALSDVTAFPKDARGFDKAAA